MRTNRTSKHRAYQLSEATVSQFDRNQSFVHAICNYDRMSHRRFSWINVVRSTIGPIAFVTLLFCSGCYGPDYEPPYPYETQKLPTSTGGFATRIFFPSLPSISAQEAGYKPDEGYAVLYLYRSQYEAPGGLNAGGNDVAIWLDGKRLGKLPSRSRMIVSIPQGRTRIQTGMIVPQTAEALAKYPDLTTEEEQWSRMEGFEYSHNGGTEFVAEAGELYAFEFRPKFSGSDNAPRPRDPRAALQTSSSLALQR